MTRGCVVRFDPRCTIAYAAVCLTLAGSTLGFRAAIEQLNVYLRKEAVPLRESLDSIPVVLGAWQRTGEDVRYGADIETELGTKQYLLRTYERSGDQGRERVQLHIAYYTGLIDTVPHVPERCWGAAGMIMTEQPHDVALNVDTATWQCGEARNASTNQQYPTAMVRDPVTRKEQLVHLP
ncbi:MAG: exosortase-associated EpsI family protein, partial [Phycisphaerae bacterium]|nr:exosortase-associated EpsI family protein [Phycisphaerae bacterium]